MGRHGFGGPEYRYCHPCRLELRPDVAWCPDCERSTVSYAFPDDAPPPTPTVEPPAPTVFHVDALDGSQRALLRQQLANRGIEHGWMDETTLTAFPPHADEVHRLVTAQHDAVAWDDPPPPDLSGPLSWAGRRTDPSTGLPHLRTQQVVRMTIEWLRSALARRTS